MAVTRPTTEARISHRSQSARTSSRFSGVTMASIRSWLSEIITSIGVHPRLPARHPGQVDVHPHPGLGGRLRGGAGQAAGAEVLHPDGQARVEQGQARLDQLLLLEGVTDLDRRALVGPWTA